MSATGKSSVIKELKRLGYPAVDADEGHSEDGPDGDWVWQEQKIADLLAREYERPFFLSGCATNQGRFYDRFDLVILLTAPVEVILQRLEDRDTNSFGKSEEEKHRILADIEAVEPLLKRGADITIHTDRPLALVVEVILATQRTAKRSSLD